MSATLVAALFGIAVLDSLNPSLFVAQFYLLTTARPVPRLLSYVLGVLAVNFGGGLLLLAGFGALIAAFFSNLSTGVLSGLELVLGVGLLLFGLWVSAAPRELDEGRQPHSLHPLHTFILGAVVMVNELTTALPYFIALERIANAQLGLVGNLLALIWYNLVFAAPLFGFIVAYLALRQRFTAQLARISAAIARWTPRVIKYGAIIFGLGLVIDGVMRLV